MEPIEVIFIKGRSLLYSHFVFVLYHVTEFATKSRAALPFNKSKTNHDSLVHVFPRFAMSAVFTSRFDWLIGSPDRPVHCPLSLGKMKTAKYHERPRSQPQGPVWKTAYCLQCETWYTQVSAHCGSCFIAETNQGALGFPWWDVSTCKKFQHLFKNREYYRALCCDKRLVSCLL